MNIVFNGKIFNIVQNGKFQYMDKNSAVACLPVKDGKAYLVKQYRHAISDQMIEIPSGKLEDSDYSDINDKKHTTHVSSMNFANRMHAELFEEVGITNANLKYLNSFYVSCGVSNEKIYVYYADSFHYNGIQNLDEDEDIEIKIIDVKDLESMIMSGLIKDSKTIIAFYMARERGLI